MIGPIKKQMEISFNHIQKNMLNVEEENIAIGRKSRELLFVLVKWVVCFEVKKNPHKSTSFFYFLILLVKIGFSCGSIIDGSFKFQINFQTWTRTALHRKRWRS